MSDPNRFRGESQNADSFDPEQNCHPRTCLLLHRITQCLGQDNPLEALLEDTVKAIRSVMNLGGVSVILPETEKELFRFAAVSFEDPSVGRQLEAMRFPVNEGVAGQVYRTGKAMIVANYPDNTLAYGKIDRQTQYQTQNMAAVPLSNQDDAIGVLCAVNKSGPAFDQTDLELLNAVAAMIALAMEKGRVQHALQSSERRIETLIQNRDRVLNHFSHELKTPLAVLFASLVLLRRHLEPLPDKQWQEIYERAERNLQRLLSMEYKIEDILQERELTT